MSHRRTCVWCYRKNVNSDSIWKWVYLKHEDVKIYKLPAQMVIKWGTNRENQANEQMRREKNKRRITREYIVSINITIIAKHLHNIHTKLIRKRCDDNKHKDYTILFGSSWDSLSIFFFVVVVGCRVGLYIPQLFFWGFCSYIHVCD